MPEPAQTLHGWPVPQHTLGDRLIKRIIVGTHVPAPVASVSFDAIPQWFRNLRLYIVGRSNAAVTFVTVELTANDDSGATQYGYSEWHYTSTTVSGTESTGAPSMTIGWLTGDSATAGAPGAIVADIIGYTSTEFHKTLMSSVFGQATASAANTVTMHRGGVWRSTDVLRKITLVPSSGSFLRNTQFDLYGEP